MYYYLIIILIFLFSLKEIQKNTSPSSLLINKSYPTSEDNISTILDRIEWGNHYPGRVEYVYRFLAYAFVITFISHIIIYNKLGSGKIFLQMMISIFFILFMLHSFFSHHADKFFSYSIDENISLLRKKLNKKRGNFKNLSRTTKNFSGKDGCFRFFYRFDS
jgi:hypothetical protein